jgi:hypothetical protein
VTIQNIVDFITYVAPGFIASEIYYSHYPVKQRTALTQLAQSVVGGVVIVSLIRWLDTDLLAGAIHSSLPGIPDIRFAFALIAFGLLSGYVAVAQLSLRSTLARRFERLSWLSYSPDSIWQFVNRPDVKDWSVVYLKDGSIYLGWISRYRFDPDAPDQDFLLAKARRVNDRLRLIYEVDGIGVYLNTRDVNRVEFVESPSPKKRRPRRAA